MSEKLKAVEIINQEVPLFGASCGAITFIECYDENSDQGVFVYLAGDHEHSLGHQYVLQVAQERGIVSEHAEVIGGGVLDPIHLEQTKISHAFGQADISHLEKFITYLRKRRSSIQKNSSS